MLRSRNLLMFPTSFLIVWLLTFTTTISANDAIIDDVVAATVETVEAEDVQSSSSSYPVNTDGACAANLIDAISTTTHTNFDDQDEDIRRDPLQPNMKYYPTDPGGNRQWAQGPYRTKILDWIKLSELYLKEQLAAADSDEQRDRIRKECRNWNMFCNFFATVQNECPSAVSDQEEVEIGEDARYMIDYCPLACQVCHLDYAEDEEIIDNFRPLLQEETATIQEAIDNADSAESDDMQDTSLEEEDIVREEDDDEDDDEEYDDDEDIFDIDVNEFVLVPSKWGVDQKVFKGMEEQIHEIIEETDEYIEGFSNEENYEQQKAYYDNLQSVCVNDDAMCSYYAATGQCEDDEEDEDIAYDFMLSSCSAACLLCDEIHIRERCPTKDVYAGVWDEAGDLDKFFERIVSDEYYQEEYGPVTLHGNPKEDYDMPWIVTFDNFLTDEECERLIELGAHEGYERSSEVGTENDDGSHDFRETERRTSTNSWCHRECSKDPVTQSVHAKINNITSLPSENSEFLQMLRYTPGQYYKEHHDYIDQEWNHVHGPRILTVFLYLNDVEAGGGTHFSNLDLTVQPKRGRMVMWPSVLNDYPFRFDPRTHHEALEVEAGIKYGANAWIHQRDFKGPFGVSCT